MDSERTDSSMHMRAPVTAPLSRAPSRDTITHSATMHIVAFYECLVGKFKMQHHIHSKILDYSQIEHLQPASTRLDPSLRKI